MENFGRGARGLDINIALARPRRIARTTGLFAPPPLPRASFRRSLRWDCAELSLRQPCKFSSRSDGGLPGDLQKTEVLFGLSLEPARSRDDWNTGRLPLCFDGSTIQIVRNCYSHHALKFLLDPTVQSPAISRLLRRTSDLGEFLRRATRYEFISASGRLSAPPPIEVILGGVMCHIHMHLHRRTNHQVLFFLIKSASHKLISSEIISPTCIILCTQINRFMATMKYNLPLLDLID